MCDLAGSGLVSLPQMQYGNCGCLWENQLLEFLYLPAPTRKMQTNKSKIKAVASNALSEKHQSKSGIEKPMLQKNHAQL